MELEKLIQKYYIANKHMQLATSNKNEPWICTVYYASDSDFNIYWTSSRSRQHSIEIASNPQVAISIVRDTERKQALQIVGRAYEAADEDLEKIHETYTAKYGPKPNYLENIRQHLPDGRAYYMFKPTEISLWDEVNFPDSPKQKYILG